MLEFIKMFGLGIFYTIISPVILAIFALFVGYSLVNYLLCEVINLSGFFFGKRFVVETNLEKTMTKLKNKNRELSESSEEQKNVSEIEVGDLDE